MLKTTKKYQNGNALFLILIAVALFAALSYALTSSGRGGGSIDKEKAEILAAQLMSQISDYQSRIQRLELGGGYDCVLFDDSAPTDTGKCYNGGAEISNQRTIGLFHPESGAPLPQISAEIDPLSGSGYQYYTGVATRQVLVNGVDVGSSAPDRYFYIETIHPEVCNALNKKLQDISGPIATAFAAVGSQGMTIHAYNDGSFVNSNDPTGAGMDEATDAGCIDLGGGYTEFQYVFDVH